MAAQEFTDRVAEELALAAHRWDRDDLHRETGTHPGGVIWPTVLALGAERGASGRRGLAAAMLGYQATISLAPALGRSHRGRWHVTTTAGSVGASIAPAWLIAEDVDVAAQAAGHAISFMGGSPMFRREHSQTDLIHRRSCGADRDQSRPLCRARVLSYALGDCRSSRGPVGSLQRM